MNFIFTNSSQQYISVIISVLLIIGNFYLGKRISNKWFGDFKIDSKYFSLHYIVLGNILLNFFLQYLIIFGFANTKNIQIIGYILILYGLYSIYIERLQIANTIIYLYSKLKNVNNSSKLILLLIIGFATIALAPITNADSLDYHIGVPLSILNHGRFIWQPTWFHQGLFGIGENSILLSLALNAEQFSTLLQLASIFSIIGLFYYGHNNLMPSEYKNLLILIFISVPVLLFLSSSPKPQLIGIAISCFLFLHIILKKINFTFRNFFLIFFLLFYIIAIKLNFLFSSFILTIAFLLGNRKIIFSLNPVSIYKYILIILSCFILVLGPILYYKSQIFGLNLSSYIYPIPDYYPGQKMFLEYLKHYDDVKLFFPLSLILPSSFGVYSMVLGLNLVVLIFVAVKNRLEYKNYIYIFIYCIVSYFFGQKTSRFYLEPMLWLLLVVNSNSKIFYYSNYLKLIIYIISFAQLSILAFSSLSLSRGILTKKQREKVLNSKANGYALAEWVNIKLPKTAKLLIDHRSMALFNQKIYSSDWVNYVDKTKHEDKFYLNYLKNEKVEFILIIGDKQDESKLFNYCNKLVYGPFIGEVATRNPFNSGRKYKAWIYTSKF